MIQKKSPKIITKLNEPKNPQKTAANANPKNLQK